MERVGEAEVESRGGAGAEGATSEVAVGGAEAGAEAEAEAGDAGANGIGRELETKINLRQL